MDNDALGGLFDELEKIGYYIPIPIPQTAKGQAALLGATGLLTAGALGAVAYKRHKGKPQRELFKSEFDKQLKKGVDRKTAYSRASSAVGKTKTSASDVFKRALRAGTKRVSGGALRRGAPWPSMGALESSRAHHDVFKLGKSVPSQSAKGEFLAKAVGKTKSSGFVDAVIKNISTNPVKYYAAGRRHEGGKERHRRTMEAVEHSYPAGWVSLGMRPQ